MDCTAMIGTMLCAALAREPAMQTREARGEEYVRVASAGHRSYRRHHRYRYRWHRKRRVVVVYRQRAELEQPAPGPCEAQAPLLERTVKTETIIMPRVEPAKLVREAFEELSVNALVSLGRSRSKW